MTHAFVVRRFTEPRALSFWAGNNVRGRKGFQPKTTNDSGSESEPGSLDNDPAFREFATTGSVAGDQSMDDDTSYGSGAVLDHTTVVDEDFAIEAAEYGLAWNRDAESGDALILQEAARRRMGQSTATDSWGTPWGRRDLEGADTLLEANRNAVKSYFPTGTVKLYRGTEQPEIPMGKSDVSLRPLSSWTLDRGEAATFGSTILTATVPTSRIAGMPGFGLGNAVHSEVVIYGGTMTVNATKAKP